VDLGKHKYLVLYVSFVLVRDGIAGGSGLKSLCWPFLHFPSTGISTGTGTGTGTRRSDVATTRRPTILLRGNGGTYKEFPPRDKRLRRNENPALSLPRRFNIQHKTFTTPALHTDRGSNKRRPTTDDRRPNTEYRQHSLVARHTRSW